MILATDIRQMKKFYEIADDDDNVRRENVYWYFTFLWNESKNGVYLILCFGVHFHVCLILQLEFSKSGQITVNIVLVVYSVDLQEIKEFFLSH